LAQRLLDKLHSWVDLKKLIPNMILEGLCGYSFSCPDMIGGGMWTSFFDESILDQDIVVRSAQCHALMPMMQFSVAPWRILDAEHMEAVRKTVALRMKFTPLIMQLAREAAKTGIPIMRSLEFEFPNQGLEQIVDEFMLGSNVLVAPMLEKGNLRKVILPNGKWKSPDGKILKGGKTYELNVGLDQLLYFELEN
jgi:alpha-glucosidase